MRTLGGVCALLAGDRRVTGRSQNCAPYMGNGRHWLAGDWPTTRGNVLIITAAAWTAGFQWWRSGDITRTQNVSEYMLVLALCLVIFCQNSRVIITQRSYSTCSLITTVSLLETWTRDDHSPATGHLFATADYVYTLYTSLEIQYVVSPD